MDATRGLRRIAIFFLLLLAGGWAGANTAPPEPQWIEGPQPDSVEVLVGPHASAAERIFQTDLYDLLHGVFGQPRLAMGSTYLPRQGKAILIGTPASFPLIARYVKPERLKHPESFVVTTTREGGCELGIIAGADPRGVAYGVYRLMEKLGWGFYLAYDAEPVNDPHEAFSFKGWDLADAPLFPNRLVFNWHNFLSGCSTWNLEEWQKWIIQSQKMGYNAVMVHAYGNNPMVQFEMNGVKKPVGYLSTTRSGRDWSTMHVSDVRRMWGGEVFTWPIFGAKAAQVPDEQRVAAVTGMMHDAIETARRRAMNVFFAFDIETFQANPQDVIKTLPESARFLVPSNAGDDKLWLANPDTPEGYAYYKVQVETLLRNYPQITHLVCWFRWSGATPWMKMKLESMPPAWQAEYRREIEKTPEAAKLAQAEGCFALSKAIRAYARALKDLGRPEIKVATGTWDFNFYPPCDRFMPKDVMFIGLDYSVLHDKSAFDDAGRRQAQAEVGAHREIVPIAWAQHDDGNYLGRSYTPFPEFASRLAEMKTAGYGIIHWTTRPLDLYFKSLVEQVWETTKDRPLRETCAAMAERSFGAAAREKGGEYLEKWVREAPKFSRETSDYFVDRKLDDPTTVTAACQARLALLGAVDESKLSAQGRDRLEYYKGLEQFIADVHQTEAIYRNAQELLVKGDLAGARRAMADCRPEPVIERFAKFSSLGGISRGEQGSVVTMNTRWLPHIVRLRQALGMDAVRVRFAPTQHDPLAQSRGLFTFHFDPARQLWQTLGTEETGAPVFVLPSEAKVSAKEGVAPGYDEIGRSGIETDKPLTLSLGPILAKGSRKQPLALGVPAGEYQLSLLMLDPTSTAAGQRVFNVQVKAVPVAAGPARRVRAGSSGMTWYPFAQPVKAMFLRLVCDGSDLNDWNSINEVKLDTLAAGEGSGAVTASAAKAGFAAQAALDGKALTRWAAQGKGQWIQFPLDPAKETQRIGIAWYEGDKRQYRVSVMASEDGKAWREVVLRAAGETDSRPGSRKAGDFRSYGALIDLFKEAGRPACVVRRDFDVKLDQPGALELTLTPITGKAVLSGAILTPKQD